MTDDPIQHLRETVHTTIDGTVTIRDDATVDDLKRVIHAMRDYPALLAVAEAARHHEIVRNRSSQFDEYEASRKVLQEALAKLDEVNHD